MMQNVVFKYNKRNKKENNYYVLNELLP